MFPIPEGWLWIYLIKIKVCFFNSTSLSSRSRIIVSKVVKLYTNEYQYFRWLDYLWLKEFLIVSKNPEHFQCTEKFVLPHQTKSRLID